MPSPRQSKQSNTEVSLLEYIFRPKILTTLIFNSGVSDCVQITLVELEQGQQEDGASWTIILTSCLLVHLQSWCTQLSSSKALRDKEGFLYSRHHEAEYELVWYALKFQPSEKKGYEECIIAL